jgi:glucosamine--fructose-6-phosphate aminotransferase (isomerizing)
VIAVVDQGDEHLASLCNRSVQIPPACALLAPVIATIPLQLLAYHMADLRGTDVDQPRNLAKSVTVE